MYNKSKEKIIFKESLRYMIKARDVAHELHMTDHGPLHAQRVYTICRWLSTLFSLTEYELSLLHAAALLHDIGMVSSNRKMHNEESEKLVIQAQKDSLLPFTKKEAHVVGILCRWHRGNDYNSSLEEKCGTKFVRIGLLASILRLADELDLDFRRTDCDSIDEMKITAQYKESQLKYHESVLSILGVRVRVNNTGKYFELLVEDITAAALQIERLVKEILATPLPLPVTILPQKEAIISPYPQEQPSSRACIFAYCNPHGLLTAVLSKISFNLTGITAEIVCDKQRTGNAKYFWKNNFDTIFKGFDIVQFIDLHIDNESIELVEKIIDNNINCKIFISTATILSGNIVTRLIKKGVTLFLGDEHVLFYTNFLQKSMPFWIKVTALCNLDNYVIQKNTNKDIHNVTKGLTYAVLAHYNGKKSNLLEIITNIENDNRNYFINLAKEFEKYRKNFKLDSIQIGRVVLVKSEPDIPGRFIYEWLLDLIMHNSCLPYEHLEFSTPYVIYPISHPDRESVIVLFVSYAKNTDTTLPMRCFCDFDEESIGKDNTIWRSYKNKTAAEKDIIEIIKAINEEYGEETSDFHDISKYL